MRKIIVYNVVSLDGFHTGPENDVTAMFPIMGKVFDTYNAELLHEADVHLVGRVSFELFQSFWPKVAQNPDSEEWTPEQKELSKAGQSVNTIVGLRFTHRDLAGRPHHQARGCVPADWRTQTSRWKGHPDNRQ